MNLFLSLIMTLIFVILILFLVNVFIWKWTIGWAPTMKENAIEMIEIAEIEKGEKLFDLGCGDGRFLSMASKKGAKAIGIEIEPLMYFISKTRSILSKNRDNIEVRYGNFYKIDLREADIVIMYLSPKVNRRIKPKLEKELRPGAVVLSHQFKIPNWVPSKVIKEKEIYKYKIPESTKIRDDLKKQNK